jgi:penicillin-binding protein 2
VAVKLGFCATGRVLPQHAWFISFAPVENPQIVTIVYIYNGGQGSEQAVPVTKKMLDYYFGRTKPKS